MVATEQSDEIQFRVKTRSNNIKPATFKTLEFKVSPTDDMLEVRRTAWAMCHSADLAPFPENKLFDSSLNVVVGGRKIGVFSYDDNTMTVQDWLCVNDIEDYVTLVMPLNNEDVGGGT